MTRKSLTRLPTGQQGRPRTDGAILAKTPKKQWFCNGLPRSEPHETLTPTIHEGLPPSLVFWEFPFLTSHNFGRQYEIHVIQSFPHLLLRNWGFREWGEHRSCFGHRWNRPWTFHLPALWAGPSGHPGRTRPRVLFLPIFFRFSRFLPFWPFSPYFHLWPPINRFSLLCPISRLT